MQRAVYAVATMDTKGEELAFVAERLRAAGVPAVTVDVGTRGEPALRSDVDRSRVASHHPEGADAVLGKTDRGQAVAAMAEALKAFLATEYAAGKVAGVLGLGGSGGTALLAPAFRSLPIGLPKAIISTVAGGNVAAYVGCSDLLLIPSIADVAGLNVVTRRVLADAAHAIVGVVTRRSEIAEDRPAIGMTMFGVTTPCVDAVRRALDAAGFDCLVFHATGIGGRTMEKLVESGAIQGVLDITTTEVADELVGGIFPAGPERFDAILEAEIPYVLSLGALDMVNFAAKETVPERFHERRLHVHNSQITLMRTTPEENRRCARWIAAKLNRSTSPVTVLIPEGGVSALDAPGQPFHDPEADAALFEELERSLDVGPDRVLRREPYHVNDPAFAERLVREFQRAWDDARAAT